MKRGCLVGLTTWAGFGAAYWYVFHARLAPPLDWIVPAGAGLVMAMVAGTVRIAFASARDAVRVTGHPGVIGERPQDGDVVTVAGRIRATGSPMRAPISGRPAVLYSYEISHVSQLPNDNRNIKDYSGFALTPAIIDSPYGPIRLLGFPMLDAFEKEMLINDPASPAATSYDENAVHYVAGTQFIDLTGFHPKALYREVKDLMTDDDGQLRKDWRMRDDVEGDVAGSDFFEQIVAPGEQVCAIGRYSAEKGGLVPDISHGRPLQLLRGEARAASGAMWQKMGANIASAIVFTAVVNGILFGVFKLHEPGPRIALPKNKAQLERNIDALHDAARNGDLTRVEELVKDGTPVDARDAENATPLIRASEANTVTWLVAHGADVNASNDKGQTALMERAGGGDAEAVKVLIKSGANLDAVSTTWKSTALQQALHGERLEVVRILREAGARDDTVTELSGHAVKEDSGEVRACQAYLDAIQREDRAAMNTLATRGPYDDVDFRIWKGARFAKGQLVSGFANDSAATISLRGARPDGQYSTWTYQLVRRDGAWKVSDERWETRLDGPSQ